MAADSEKPLCGPWGWDWLQSSAGCEGGADLRGLRGGCGSSGSRISHESALKSAPETSRSLSKQLEQEQKKQKWTPHGAISVGTGKRGIGTGKKQLN